MAARWAALVVDSGASKVISTLHSSRIKVGEITEETIQESATEWTDKAERWAQIPQSLAFAQRILSGFPLAPSLCILLMFLNSILYRIYSVYCCCMFNKKQDENGDTNTLQVRHYN